jgi:hypothetical protein
MELQKTNPILRNGLEHIKSPIELGGYSITSHGYVYGQNGKQLVQRVKNGYATIGLQINGKKKMFFVHRLVACFFNPLGYALTEKHMQVNHINGNKLDNHIDNLEWVTPSENSKHAWQNGLCENVKQKTSEANSKIVLDLSTGIYYKNAKEASEAVGLKYGTLRNMLNGHDRNKTSLIYA